MIISSNNQALLICNIALSYVGLNAITSFEDNNKESILCKFWYELSKIEVLSSYPFKATIREVHLQPIKEAGNFQTGHIIYSNYYALPANCLEVISVNNSNLYYSDDRILSCNFSSVVLRYIYNLKDNEIPTSLAKLISLKLACNISMALQNDVNFVNYMSKRYDNEYKKITNADSKKGNVKGIVEHNEEETSWILSRR